MDLIKRIRLSRWIFILGLICQLSIVMSQRSSSSTSVSRTTITRRYSISRTTKIIHSTKLMPQASRASSSRPCVRPSTLAGLIQFITVDRTANITNQGKTFPEGTTINYACQDPGRTRLVGSSSRRCLMGIWTAPAPTCETVRTQFGLTTSPDVPRSSTIEGAFAIYLTPYTTYVDITCLVLNGSPELTAPHISDESARAERYESAVGGGQTIAGLRISAPEPGDGGTFTCANRDVPAEMHDIEIVFDDQRYALQDPCPSDITVPAEFNSTHAFVTWDPPSLLDPMNEISLRTLYTSGNRFNLGKTDVTYNVSDILGMAEVCVFTVTVADMEPPNIVGCPDDITVPTDPGRAMAQVGWDTPTAWDNTGQVTLVTKSLVGSYFGIGSFPIAYSATDAAGNEATCSFTVTVEDREPPSLTCPPDIVVETLPSSMMSIANWSLPTIRDNSGYTISLSDPGTEGRFTYGKTNRTYSVQDGSGNIANCSFTVHVRDAERPRFMNCPRSIERYLETYHENATTVRWQEPIADDNVGIAWPWSRSHTPGSKFGAGTHHVVYAVSDLQGNNVTCEFDVTVIEARCPAERTEGENGIHYTWLSTITSTLANSVESCPVFTEYGGHPLAVRFCEYQYSAVGIWRDVMPRVCGRNIAPLDLYELSRVPVSQYNIKEVARVVEGAVENQTSFSVHDLDLLTGTLENIVDVHSASKTVSKAFAGIVDQVIQSDLPITIQNDEGASIGPLIELLDRQLMQSAEGNKTLHISTPYLAVRTASVYPDDVILGLTFAPVTSEKNGADDADGEEESEEGLIRTILKNDTEPVHKHLQIQASLHLPQLVFDVAYNGSAIPVSFVVFKDASLFPSASLRLLQENVTRHLEETTWSPSTNGDSTPPPQSYRMRQVLGPVMSASIAGGISIVNLTDPVVLEFAVEEGLNISNIECVYWDFDLDEGRGDWSADGCQFEGRGSDGGIVCHCTHLTNFAVLVDIHGQFNINPTQKLALDIITRIGCFLSIAGLAFTILTFLLFKSLRSNRSRQILIHLCIALLALYVVFVCGIVATDVEYACATVAALLHYLVLVTIMWMGVEARHMYVMLVRVFKSDRSHFVIKAALIAWGVPIVPVAISLGLSFGSYQNQSYCFLVPGHVMYYGLLLPIGAILVHNIVTFSLAIRNLLCSNLSGTAVNKTKREQVPMYSGNPEVDHKVISRLQNAVCMSVLLGLTWSFGFLAVGAATFVFRLLFCVFNSFQGFIIFALFCIRSKEVRNAWGALSIIECNFRSQSYRVKEKSYIANSESAWHGPCVIDWGDAPGLDAYMQANKQRFRDSGTSEESRVPTYSISAPAVNSNNKVTNNAW